MKTIEEIIKQEPVFMGYWDNQEGVAKEFEENLDDIKVLFASYGSYSYDGDAFVLYEKDGNLYETHGSHCSCYGLEGQWTQEEVVLEELANRLVKGTFGDSWYHGTDFKPKLLEFIGA